METKLRLNPGQNGTKALTKKYDDRLVCVRYLYDYENRRRHKTVELIEETVPWNPQGSRESHLMQPATEESVLVRVEYSEHELRRKIKEAGGWWLPDEKAWSIQFAKVAALGLEQRILDR